MNELSPKQLDSVLRSTARINIWDGSVRSGKTVATFPRWLEYAINGPSGEYVMVGKTERTLKRNIINPLKEMLGKDLRYNQGEGEIYIKKRRIYVAGANDERAADKIRGLTLAGAYGDELTLYPESFFKMLLTRLSVPGAQLFGTTNPDSPYHYLKTDYIDRVDELNCKIFKFKIDDNPFLSKEYVDALKKEFTGLFYKRFILGLWVLAEGVIFDMWDEDIHIVRTLRDNKKHIVGVDYGTSNPCTYGLYGFNGNAPPVQLEKEYYHDGRAAGRQKTDAQYADDMVAWLGNVRPIAVYVDPSAASFIAELKARRLPVKKAKNDVLDGIRYVSGLLFRNEYTVHGSCRETPKGYAAYVWDEKAQKRGEDKPVKQNDHVTDRDRYALYTHFGNGPGIISGAKVISRGR